MVIRPDQLDRHTVVDPAGPPYRRRGHTRHHAATLRPQPGRAGAVRQRQDAAPRSVHIRVQPLVVPPQLVARDGNFRQLLTADEDALHPRRMSWDDPKAPNPSPTPS